MRNGPAGSASASPPPGPGGIHLLNGLYDAKLDGQPVLAITGLQFHDLVHTYTQQDVELDKLFMDVCVYNARIMGADPRRERRRARLPHGAGLSRRRSRHVPGRHAVQEVDEEQALEAQRRRPRLRRDGALGARLPSEEQLARAAEILNAGKKTAILAGRGALGARAELCGVAERLGAPIIKRCSARARCRTTAPTRTGGIGLLGTRPSQEALEDCDTLLIAGKSFPTSSSIRSPARRAAVQIELDPEADRPALSGRGRARRRQPRASSQALLPRSSTQDDRAFLEKAQGGMEEWSELMEERGTRDGQADEAAGRRARAQQAAVATTPSSPPTPAPSPPWAARHLDDARQHDVLAAPATSPRWRAACPTRSRPQIAYPGRQVRRLRRRRRLDHADGRARDLREIRARREDRRDQEQHARPDQMGADGVPRQSRNTSATCSRSTSPRWRAASASQASRSTIRRSAARCCEEALATPGPVLVEAVVDPNEPPMPPKITLKQAAHLRRVARARHAGRRQDRARPCVRHGARDCV